MDHTCYAWSSPPFSANDFCRNRVGPRVLRGDDIRVEELRFVLQARGDRATAEKVE